LRTPFLLVLAAVVSATPALAAERTFSVSDFTKVKLSGSADVSVATGSAASARATGSEADLDRLVLEVRGGELVISQKSGSWNWGREGIRVFVTVPALEAATVNGSGDMVVDRVKGQAFSGVAAGSGDLQLGAVDVRSVSLAVNGSGDVVAAGRCDSGTFSLNGSGDISAAGLKCRDVTVSVNGSGDIAAHASGSATAALNGSGDINITGGARCTKAARGSGDISCS
jgi:hypothetical protein